MPCLITLHPLITAQFVLIAEKFPQTNGLTLLLAHHFKSVDPKQSSSLQSLPRNQLQHIKQRYNKSTKGELNPASS